MTEAAALAKFLEGTNTECYKPLLRQSVLAVLSPADEGVLPGALLALRGMRGPNC